MAAAVRGAWKRHLKRDTKCLNRHKISTISIFYAPIISYTLSNPLALPMATVSMIMTLDRAKGQTAYSLCPSLIAYISPRPYPYLSHHLADYVAAFENT